MPYLAPEARHADQFLGAEVGRQEGEAGDPDRNGAAGGEKVAAGRDLLAKAPADAQHEGEVEGQNDVVYRSECQSLTPEVLRPDFPKGSNEFTTGIRAKAIGVPGVFARRTMRLALRKLLFGPIEKGMPDNGLLGELIYCAGWIAIGSAIMYTQRRKRRLEVLRRLAERLQECPAVPASAPEAAAGPAASPAFAESLARLAAATGESVPIASGEGKAAPAGRR